MANVGKAIAGKTLIGKGLNASPAFEPLGTDSGLADGGVVIAQGNGAFTASNAGSAGQMLISNGPGIDPSFQSGGAVVGNTITGDDSVALSPTAGNWNILGQDASTVSVMDTNGSGSTLRVENRTWTSKFIVDPSATVGLRGTYQTIGAAITAASSGDTIFIRSGTYTENLTAKAGVSLVGYVGNDSSSAANIVGKITFTTAGTYNLSGLNLTTNSDYVIECTGSNAVILVVNNCYFNVTNSNAILSSISNASHRLRFFGCTGRITSAGFSYFVLSSTGSIGVNNCFLDSASNTTYSAISNGTFNVQDSLIRDNLQITGTDTRFRYENSQLNPQGNVTPLVYNATTGADTAFVTNSRIRAASGTAEAVTIGAGAVLHIYDSSIYSINGSAAISGSGTLKFGNLTFDFQSAITCTLDGVDENHGPLSLDGGTVQITSFSTDGTLAGNSNSILSTQRAVKTYVDDSLQKPSFSNLGMTLSGGTFSITSEDGTALSSTNVAYVVLPSKTTPGTFVKYTISADQSFIDDAGSSEIIGNLFGFTTGVAVTSAVPFYIYAVSNDNQDTIQFMLSRLPNRTTSPVEASIGAPDDPVADNQWSFWSFDSINEALFDSNPCLCVGSMIMRMSASDDWTVDPLTQNLGIGIFQEKSFFGNQLGQFGANSSSISVNNGGTAPVFGNTVARYFLDTNGFCFYQFNAVNDGGTDGSGAVTAIITVPFIPLLGSSVSENPAGATFVTYAGGSPRQTIPFFIADQNQLVFRENNTANFVQWASFTNGGRQISGSVYYRIKDS